MICQAKEWIKTMTCAIRIRTFLSTNPRLGHLSRIRDAPKLDHLDIRGPVAGFGMPVASF
jgi:hypothetical protein